MWKSGWKINKDWVKGKEKWMLLLVCGLILLILSFPPGSKKDKEEEAGSPVVQGQLGAGGKRRIFGLADGGRENIWDAGG